jgi:hypothetical protein
MASQLLSSAPPDSSSTHKPTRLCRIAEASRRVLSKPAGYQAESRVVHCGAQPANIVATGQHRIWMSLQHIAENAARYQWTGSYRTYGSLRGSVGSSCLWQQPLFAARIANVILPSVM